jgi:hypothetical protein
MDLLAARVEPRAWNGSGIGPRNLLHPEHVSIEGSRAGGVGHPQGNVLKSSWPHQAKATSATLHPALDVPIQVVT